jgi:hypothetical protein
MAWPTAAELKQRLDITSDDWDDHMDRLIAHGIAWVKAKVGDWNEDTDAPDDALAQAALERAVEQATTGESVAGTSLPRKSESLLYGHRRRFGIG